MNLNIELSSSAVELVNLLQQNATPQLLALYNITPEQLQAFQKGVQLAHQLNELMKFPPQEDQASQYAKTLVELNSLAMAQNFSLRATKHQTWELFWNPQNKQVEKE